MEKPIDMVAVRESLAALDRIAAEHPELLGKSAPEEWEQILKEQVTERQRKLVAKRLTQGQKRALVWAPETDLDALKRAYPGPRNGVNWMAVIAAALDKAGQQNSKIDRIAALPSLDDFRETMPGQQISAGEFCRSMRDDERY